MTAYDLPNLVEIGPFNSEI